MKEKEISFTSMHPNGVCTGRTPRLVRAQAHMPRDPHARLIAALLGLAGLHTRLASASSRPWASATFVGAQHRIVLTMADADDGARAAAFAAQLPEAELRIPGHIVADITIDERITARENGELVTRFTLTALTVEDW